MVCGYFETLGFSFDVMRFWLQRAVLTW